MSLSNDMRGVLTCSYCQNLYEQPIMLPCQDTICRKDLANLYMKSSKEDIRFRSFKCPCCSCVHEEPLSGFPEDKKMKKILELHGVSSAATSTSPSSNNNSNGSFSCESYNLAKACCVRLSELYAEYTKVKENPFSFIDRYFDRIRRVIDDNRQENKQIIDQIYDDFIKDLKKFENECVKFTRANHDPDKGSNNYETYSEFSTLPDQLIGWQDELNLNKNNEEKCKNIGSSIRKLESELSVKHDQFKKSLLLNREIKFKQSILDKSDTTRYGQIKVASASEKSGGAELSRRPSMQTSNPASISRTESIHGRMDASLGQFKSMEYCESSDTEQQYLQDAVQLNNSKRRSKANIEENLSNSDSGTRVSKNGNTEATSPKNLYITVTDYDAKTSEELSFEKGDVLIINDEDKRSETQWVANVLRRSNSNSQSTSSKPSGLVNPSHVAKKAVLDNEPWYYGSIKRKDAELLLKRDGNSTGSYMIRESETNNDTSHCFSLSVRDQSTDIKHYKILNSVENGAFVYFLNPKVKFKSLNELIDYHSKKSEGLCTALTEPCQK